MLSRAVLRRARLVLGWVTVCVAYWATKSRIWTASSCTSAPRTTASPVKTVSSGWPYCSYVMSRTEDALCGVSWDVDYTSMTRAGPSWGYSHSAAATRRYLIYTLPNTDIFIYSSEYRIPCLPRMQINIFVTTAGCQQRWQTTDIYINNWIALKPMAVRQRFRHCWCTRLPSYYAYLLLFIVHPMLGCIELFE